MGSSELDSLRRVPCQLSDILMNGRQMRIKTSISVLLRNFYAQERSSLIALAYAMWLLPAVLGAVLDWSPWLVLALLVPGLIWYGAGEGVRRYKEGRRINPETPLIRRVPVLASLPAFVVAIAFPTRFSGVLVVVGFVFGDLGSWWRKSRRADGTEDRRHNIEAG